MTTNDDDAYDRVNFLRLCKEQALEAFDNLAPSYFDEVPKVNPPCMRHAEIVFDFVKNGHAFDRDGNRLCHERVQEAIKRVLDAYYLNFLPIEAYQAAYAAQCRIDICADKDVWVAALQWFGSFLSEKDMRNLSPIYHMEISYFDLGSTPTRDGVYMRKSDNGDIDRPYITNEGARNWISKHVPGYG